MQQLENSNVSIGSVKAIIGFVISTMVSGFSVYSAMTEKVSRLETRIEHMEKSNAVFLQDNNDFKRTINADIAEIKKAQVEILLNLTKLTADVEHK